MGRKYMKAQDLYKAKSPELRASPAAMARKIAIQTNTCLVIVQDGKVVRIPPDQLRREEQEKEKTE